MSGSWVQLDLFAPPPVPIVVDDLPRLLEAAGYGNSYVLETNRTLGEWGTGGDIPSRLFHFPIEFMAGDRREDGKSKLLLNHPLIGSHPFVREVEKTLGFTIEWEDEDEFERDRGAHWRYVHAVDLATDKNAAILEATREYTDPDAVASGVSCGVRYGALTPARGRELLLSFGHVEPGDRSAAKLAAGVIRPDPIYADDNGKARSTPRYGMNEGGRCAAIDIAWAFIHGLEDGLFAIPKRGKSHYITMAPEGLKRLAHLIRPQQEAA